MITISIFLPYHRNLSFDVDHDAFYEFFVSFGPLEFAKVVKDPSISHSRGTGFVKFTRTEDVARVLSEGSEIEPIPVLPICLCNQNTSRLILDGRAERLRSAKKETPIVECTAVPCSMAERLRQQGRNLHLARVRMIRAGTVAAEGLSKEDLAKREALLRSKKLKLQNPNIFISDVRLCVRNLPLTVSDEDLRRVCLDFLGADNKRCLTEVSSLTRLFASGQTRLTGMNSPVRM
ncbi:nucleolar protein 4 [Paragonimus westermani]|uniref:Nucleolar protein 4 n=1 Tax=Paragonimus westermani TaxID=34504 RepID=A0A5J4NEQ3_9TREM|nr:nucleolar protein 4 [Paragonimus westermani]